MTPQELIEEIKKMTVLELSELVKALEEEFGVAAAMPMAMAAGPVPLLPPLRKKSRPNSTSSSRLPARRRSTSSKRCAPSPAWA